MKEKSCGAVVFYNDKVLLIKHKLGHIDFPKGHVEGDETLEETAIREVTEETGVVPIIDSSCKYVITYSPRNGVLKDVVYFLASTTSNYSVAQESEVSEVMWVDIENVNSLLTYDNTREVFRVMLDFYNSK